MTPDEFRKIALSFEGAEERSHMDHPDFRVHEKIFATLGYPDLRYAMVKLHPEQQQNFVDSNPEGFAPVKGAWGRKGSTSVLLDRVTQAQVRAALQSAWQSIPKKKLRR